MALGSNQDGVNEYSEIDVSSIVTYFSFQSWNIPCSQYRVNTVIGCSQLGLFLSLDSNPQKIHFVETFVSVDKGYLA